MNVPVSSNAALSAAAGAMLALALGCSTVPEVSVSYDRDAVFGGYSTFAFAAETEPGATAAQRRAFDYVCAASRRELEARGLRMDETSPQLLVNFAGFLSDRAPAATPTFLGSQPTGYRAGGESHWTDYPRGDATVPFTHGRLTVRLLDPARDRIVWQSTVSGIVVDTNRANLQPVVDGAVKAAFAQFPPGTTAAR